MISTTATPGADSPTPLEETFFTFTKENGVVYGEYRGLHGSYLIVADEEFEHYRITLAPCPDGLVSVGVDAEWSDDKPGNLASFTPAYENGANYCSADEILVADDGLLTVLARRRSASHVQIRVGFTVQLPPSFVAPLRAAIALLRERSSS